MNTKKCYKTEFLNKSNTHPQWWYGGGGGHLSHILLFQWEVKTPPPPCENLSATNAHLPSINSKTQRSTEWRGVYGSWIECSINIAIQKYGIHCRTWHVQVAYTDVYAGCVRGVQTPPFGSDFFPLLACQIPLVGWSCTRIPLPRVWETDPPFFFLKKNNKN